MVLPVLLSVLTLQQVQAPPSSSPADAYYFFLEARRFEDAGQIDAAVASLEKAAALDPAAAEIPAELAGVYARHNRPTEAIREAEAALAIDATNQQAHRILGNVYAMSADARGQSPAAATEAIRKAIAHFEAARPPRGVDTSIEFPLGRLYLRVGANDKAIDALTRFTQEQPGVPEVALLLSEAYAATGDLDKAARTLDDAIADEPGFYRGLIRLAEIYEEQHRWADAADAYGKALALNPRSQELRNQRAAALINAGDAAGARDLLSGATSVDRPDPGALYLFSQAARDVNDLDAAETAARRLMAAAPDDVRGPYALALVLDRRKDYKQEVATLEPALAQARAGGRPAEHVQLLQSQLAFAYAGLGDRVKALAIIDGAIKAAPGDENLEFQRASLLERTRQYPEAEKAFRALLAKDPRNAGVLNYLGYMLADRGDRLDEAVSLIQRALAADPGNPSYLDSLGWAYFKQDRLDLAEEPLKQAADRLKTSSVVQEHLGDLRFRQQRVADAIEAWTRALGGDGESIDRAALEKKIQEAKRQK